MATFIPIIGELVGEATSLLAPVAEEAKAGLTAQGVFDVANAYGKAYPDSVVGRIVNDPNQKVGCGDCSKKKKLG